MRGPKNGLGRVSVPSVTVRPSVPVLPSVLCFITDWSGLWGAGVELSKVAAFPGRGLTMVKCLRPHVCVSECKSIFTLEII